ncbi:MAG: hypothetical protein C4541_13510 [Candidatus Auribacter fodinae]|jgi:type II secretory pathway pseudopilin PulG|uniref:FecR protein domain-containing protein n=1 Tax=Candidatus Auribacter fodinae TaxID=2093366 RepID=A0A3A4QPK4_9BACT|nr:MAG: hypothetical protein C4541_13510 [Candidatus Auribacter fodinae]
MKKIHSIKGFTLLDILICITTLSVVSTIIFTAGKEVRFKANTTICMNNLRQISFAMASYYADYQDYPRGLPYGTLSAQLHSYMSNELVFLCPEDKFEEVDSYSEYYVYRGDDLASFKYVLGCPRHRRQKTATNIFSLQTAKNYPNATVLANNKVVTAGSFTSGTLLLEDNSIVETGSAEVMIVQSLRLENGLLYTVLRVPDGESGKITVNATTGTKLEVVTPSVVAGVRGTEFEVDFGYSESYPYANVTVISGSVAVVPLDGKVEYNGQLVNAGKQEMILNENMTVKIHANPHYYNSKQIGKRLDKLSRKIDRLESIGHETEKAEGLYEWLSTQYPGSGELVYDSETQQWGPPPPPPPPEEEGSEGEEPPPEDPPEEEGGFWEWWTGFWL